MFLKRNINVALVGYKFMGKAHSNGLTQLPMFFDLEANIVKHTLCGRDREWVSKSAEKFGWRNVVTDYMDAVRNPEIDAIDITAPSNAHCEIALAAAENKKHIFCEKPLALNVSDARLMNEAAKKNGVKNQIGFNYRFVPALVFAKKMIHEGRLGEIYHFRGSYLQDWIIDPAFPLVWRLDKDVCGSGSLGDLGAHVIDAARFLIGDIARVVGIERTFVKKRPIVEKMIGLSGSAAADAPLGEVRVDDATLLLCEFENGALGSIEATRFANGHNNDMSFEINGRKGSIKFSFERMNELEYQNAEDEDGFKGFRTISTTEGIHNYAGVWWPPGHVLGYENTFVHEFYEFYKAIINDTATSPSFEDGVKCSQIIGAVEASIANRSWIEVKDI